jgi:hypothetical protein
MVGQNWTRVEFASGASPLRWVQHYLPEFEKRWSRYARPVGRILENRRCEALRIHDFLESDRTILQLTCNLGKRPQEAGPPMFPTGSSPMV